MGAITEIDANLERIAYDDIQAAGLNVHLDDLEQTGNLFSRDLGRKLQALIRRFGVAQNEFLLPSSPSALFVLVSSGYGYAPSTKEVRLNAPAVFQVTAADKDKWITIQHKEIRDQSRVNVNGEIINIRKQVDTDPSSVLTIEDVETPTIEAFQEANPDKLVLGKITDVVDTPGSESVTIDTSQAIGHRFLLLATDDEKVSKDGDDMEGDLVIKEPNTLFTETTGADYRDNIVFAGESISTDPGPPAPSDAKSIRHQFFATGFTKKYRLFDKQFSKSVFEYDGFDVSDSTLKLMDDTLRIDYTQSISKRRFQFDEDTEFRKDLAFWKDGPFVQYLLREAVSPNFNFVLRQQVGSNNILVNEQDLTGLDNTVYLGGTVDSGVRPNQTVIDPQLTNSLRVAGADYIRMNGNLIRINRTIQAEATTSLILRNFIGTTSLTITDAGSMTLLSIGSMTLNGKNFSLFDTGVNAQLAVKTGGSISFAVAGVIGMTLDLNNHLDVATVGAALLKSRRNVRMAAGKRIEFGNIDAAHTGGFIETVSDGGNLVLSHVNFPLSSLILGNTVSLLSNTSLSTNSVTSTTIEANTAMILRATDSMDLRRGAGGGTSFLLSNSSGLFLAHPTKLDFRLAGAPIFVATPTTLFIENTNQIILATDILTLDAPVASRYTIRNGNSVRVISIDDSTVGEMVVGTKLEANGTIPTSSVGSRIIFDGQLAQVRIENRLSATVRNEIIMAPSGFNIGNDLPSGADNGDALRIQILRVTGDAAQDFNILKVPFLSKNPKTGGGGLGIPVAKGGLYVVKDGADVKIFVSDGSGWFKTAILAAA